MQPLTNQRIFTATTLRDEAGRLHPIHSDHHHHLSHLRDTLLQCNNTDSPQHFAVSWCLLRIRTQAPLVVSAPHCWALSLQKFLHKGRGILLLAQLVLQLLQIQMEKRLKECLAVLRLRLCSCLWIHCRWRERSWIQKDGWETPLLTVGELSRWEKNFIFDRYHKNNQARNIDAILITQLF